MIKSRMKLTKIVLCFLVIIGVTSCNYKSKLEQDLAQIQSHEVNISLDKMQHNVNGRDTLFPDFADSELKLVAYSDSLACSACTIEGMFRWDNFIKDAQKYQGQLKFYFLFSPNKEDAKTVQFALKANIFDYPIFIDSAGVFAKENPHLPKNPQLHTFLLDKNNKVILVGSPLNNPKIEEMFYKMVEERLGKK